MTNEILTGQINDVLRTSSLRNEQILIWDKVLPHISIEGLQSIIELMEGGHENVIMLTRNLEEKVAAFMSSDTSAWNGVLQNDVDFISSLK